MHSDLVRCAVIDSQPGGPSTDIHAQRFPRKRLLKNSLPQIAGKE
jgi:hypothetical protein